MARNREPQIFNISFLDVICGALGAVIFLFIAVPKGSAPPGRSNQLNVSIDTTHKQLFATISDSLAARRPGDTLLVVITDYKPMPGIAECPDCPTCPEPQPVAYSAPEKAASSKKESARKDSALAVTKPAETPPAPPDNFKKSKYEGDPPSVPCKVSIEINWADIGDNVDIFVCKGNKCVSGGAREIRDIGQWDSGKAKTKFFGSDLRTTQEAVRQFDKILPGEYKVYALFKESIKNNSSVRIRGLVYSRNDQGEEKGEPFAATLQFKAPRVLLGTVQMPENGAFQFTKN
ncbi:hypothetical protein SAMN04487996_10525 [Dyadobacter soli]|uniref:Uncharacterized protein n=1 Tax=Dyadobacter soli TaxID=659014 RepID=A0A1G7CUR9_9BACT|nr:hypothetical protein [Dyadobacter soli]SDE43049.1 hypothetical protein SAMN04487996_10525 [Dyadobacter soli]